MFMFCCLCFSMLVFSLFLTPNQNSFELNSLFYATNLYKMLKTKTNYYDYYSYVQRSLEDKKKRKNRLVFIAKKSKKRK